MSAENSYDIVAKQEDMSAVLGDGSPENPMRFFEDKYNRFSTESYGPNGEWLGWKVEHILNNTEYFKRRLMGE